jgi:hypothetical protein
MMSGAPLAGDLAAGPGVSFTAGDTGGKFLSTCPLGTGVADGDLSYVTRLLALVVSACVVCG